MAYQRSVTYSNLSGSSLILTQIAATSLSLARDLLVFPRFMDTRVELGKRRGDTIVVPIVNDIGALGTTPLVSGTEISIQSMEYDSVSITIHEYGNGVAVENALEYFTNVRLREDLQQKLALNFGITWNELCYRVFYNTAHGYIGSLAGGSAATLFRVSGDWARASSANATLNPDFVDAVYDALKSAKVPKFPDGYYRWIANAQTLRPLKNSSDWKQYQHYAAPGGGPGIRTQDLGEYRGFRFIETEESLTNGVNIVFGPHVAAQAFGLPYQVRMERDWKQDFGRVDAFAWYLIGGVGAALRDKGTYCYIVKTKA